MQQAALSDDSICLAASLEYASPFSLSLVFLLAFFVIQRR